MTIQQFIATLPADAHSALAAIEVKHDELTQLRAAYVAQRNVLPRTEKARAAALSAEIVAIEAALHDLKFHRSQYRGQQKRQQQHALWAEAVVACAGPKVLADCQRFMKSRERELHSSARGGARHEAQGRTEQPSAA